MPPRFANLEELPCDESAPRDSMITLRLPQSLHDELVDEAENLGVTLNSLVLSKVAAECWGCRIIEDGRPVRRRKEARAC